MSIPKYVTLNELKSGEYDLPDGTYEIYSSPNEEFVGLDESCILGTYSARVYVNGGEVEVSKYWETFEPNDDEIDPFDPGDMAEIDPDELVFIRRL